MDNFYVTLPSNSSVDVFPDNKKSNFTTHFNTPINLNGEYEVALTSITCTRNIKNDFGKLIIYYDNVLTFNSDLQVPIEIDLSETYDLQDKINNDVREYLTLEQIYRNSLLFIHLEALGFFKIPSRLKEDDIAVFYDIRNRNKLFILSKHPDFYERIDYYYTKLSWDDLNKYSNILLYPISNKIVEIINKTPTSDQVVQIVDKILAGFSSRKTNYQYKLDPIILEIFRDFDDIYLRINNRDDVGLFKLYCEIKDDKIKFSSNKNITLEADGKLKELVFNDSKIILDKYYYIPGKLNLIKYGIIYCDIIQEQIFGEDYRQILQIITLDNSENTPILMSNLENLQYIPVKKNFITNINISICSLTGELIKFSDDFIYTIVKLHFRKKLV